MQSYYLQKNINPKIIVTELLSTITPRDEKTIRIALGDSGFHNQHSFHTRMLFSELKHHIGYSASWTPHIFRNALRKLKHPSRKKHLEKMGIHNTQFLEMTGMDKKTLEIYLKKNFYLEYNLYCWITGGQPYGDK